MIKLSRSAFLWAALALISSAARADEVIKHEFLAVDEPRGKLHYVNEFDPSKDWSVDIGKKNRDVFLTKKGTCVISMRSGGYREYSIEGDLIKDVQCGEEIVSVVRTDDGHTFLANSNTIWELDENDTLVKKIPLKEGRLHLMRFDNEGQFAYSSGYTFARFVNRAGELVDEHNLVVLNAGVYNPFHINHLPDGRYIITLGYSRNLLVLDENMKVLRTVGYQGLVGRKPQTKNWPDTGEDVNVDGVMLHYLATAKMLDNEHIMVTNWNGHRKNDSQKGAQVIEFDEAGKIVWKWHNPNRAGSLVGLAVIR